jgi:hypothetical protein
MCASNNKMWYMCTQTEKQYNCNAVQLWSTSLNIVWMGQPKCVYLRQQNVKCKGQKQAVAFAVSAKEILDFVCWKKYTWGEEDHTL